MDVLESPGKTKQIVPSSLAYFMAHILMHSADSSDCACAPAAAAAVSDEASPQTIHSPLTNIGANKNQITSLRSIYNNRHNV